MRIAIGNDHWGPELKQTIIQILAESGHSYEDFGCQTTESVDYPDIAREVAEAVARGDFDYGILICNNGIGMSIAANKVRGIRAALCYTAFNARRTRQHQDANILCLGAGKEQAQEPVAEIVNAFLTAEFEGGRHQRRLDKIGAIEASQLGQP
ncbi:MAG: ribose 5-phosphate isomerase B [Dehalococcoidia bacterium]|nr:MAG: ribose 5-phosphate isomerase B [Dehalococcoidia bacterium]